MLYYHFLTKEDRSKLFRTTKTCPICLGKSRKSRLVVDHCHRTGIVRGVICERCNSWLGVVEGGSSKARKNQHLLKIEKTYGIPHYKFKNYLRSFDRSLGDITKVPKHTKFLKKWLPSEVVVSVVI